MRKINSFYPTLGLSWALVAVFMACSFATSFVTMALATILNISPTNSWLSVGAYVLSFALIAGFIYLLQQSKQGEEYVEMQKNRVTFFVFLLLLIFTPLVTIVIEPLTSWIPMPDFIKELFNSAFQKNTATLLMVVVAAPLCEEWLCRGVITKGLLRHSTPTKAILWSAFIFAVIHVNPWQALPAFIIGLLLGYVYWKTRSLWPCIFIHFVNNGLSFLLLYLFPEADVNTSSQDIFGSNYWLIYAGAWLLAVPVGYLLYRKLNELQINEPKAAI